MSGSAARRGLAPLVCLLVACAGSTSPLGDVDLLESKVNVTNTIDVDARVPEATEARLVPSLEALASARCRVSFDADGDDVIDARWGFEYTAAGRLQRLTHAAGDPLVLQVTVFDAEERPRLSCTRERCTRFEFGDDDDSLRVDSHIATQAEREPTYQMHFDDQSRLSSWQHSLGDERSGFDKTVSFVEGIPREATYTDFFYGSADVDSWSFFDDGSLKSRDAVHELGHDRQACTEDGWQLLESFDDGAGVAFEVATEYLRGPDGRIAQSRTTLSGPGETHLVTADWTWNGSGGAVTLAAWDAATDSRWTFQLVVTAGEVARDYDSRTGELLRVRVDLDGDGAADTVHHYDYEGAGPCRDGSNPQLRPLATSVLDVPLPHGCPHAPGIATLLEAYGLAPR